jgi:light-regulated signal transduction histidine kinase (bacteriophytochrome)
MTHIIDDLRDLADLRSAEVSHKEVDLSALGRDIINELRALRPDRDVKFEPQPGIMAVGDETLLRILLTNLLQNAWKYTAPSDDAWIELGVEEDQDGIPFYYVRDNGIGFDNVDRDRIFRTFERLHTEEDFAGSGLGLATVMRIVRRHGGRAWAEGILGQGAIVRFTLEPEVIDPDQVDRREAVRSD